MNKELLLLKLRNAIADKEWLRHYAEYQMNRGGEWIYDWPQAIREKDKEIDELISSIEKSK